MRPRKPYSQEPSDNALGKKAYLERLTSIRDDALTGEAETAGNDIAAIPVSQESWSEWALNSKPRSAIRTVAKWSVRLLIVGLAIVLVGLIVYQRPRVAPAETPSAVQPASAMTAMTARQVAGPIALAWEGDAQLVSLSAAWEAGEPFQNGEGDWSLVYYSPSIMATALISVHDGQAALIGTHGARRAIEVPRNTLWQVDSSLAIERLRAAGGDDFLHDQSDVTVSLSLDLAGAGVWSARLVDQMSRRIFAARISIDSGEIIDVQQSG